MRKTRVSTILWSVLEKIPWKFFYFCFYVPRYSVWRGSLFLLTSTEGEVSLVSFPFLWFFFQIERWFHNLKRQVVHVTGRVETINPVSEIDVLPLIPPMFCLCSFSRSSRNVIRSTLVYLPLTNIPILLVVVTSTFLSFIWVFHFGFLYKLYLISKGFGKRVWSVTFRYKNKKHLNFFLGLNHSSLNKFFLRSSPSPITIFPTP